MTKHKGEYLMLVEGSIPTGDDGIYCCIGGRTALDICREAAEGAKAIVAWGSCASNGCIQAAKPNPTTATPIHKDLLSVKARGGDVRIVYSPLDAVELARANPETQVVFFAVGFETTAPANAMAVFQAARLGLTNFSVLMSHVLVPPAIEAILSSPESRVQAFLAAGHVCTVMGYTEYEPIVAKYRVPVVVTGFEPLDIQAAIPVREDVRGACEVLGFDPCYVANEGRFVAIVAAADADRALQVLRGFAVSADAVRVGDVTATHKGLVTLRSRIGATRVMDMLSGEQLPRIC